jgi:hypothetical protein
MRTAVHPDARTTHTNRCYCSIIPTHGYCPVAAHRRRSRVNQGVNTARTCQQATEAVVDGAKSFTVRLTMAHYGANDLGAPRCCQARRVLAWSSAGQRMNLTTEGGRARTLRKLNKSLKANLARLGPWVLLSVMLLLAPLGCMLVLHRKHGVLGSASRFRQAALSDVDAAASLHAHTLLMLGGPHRGGTTLLWRLMGQHPNVSSFVRDQVSTSGPPLQACPTSVATCSTTTPGRARQCVLRAPADLLPHRRSSSPPLADPWCVSGSLTSSCPGFR